MLQPINCTTHSSQSKVSTYVKGKLQAPGPHQLVVGGPSQSFIPANQKFDLNNEKLQAPGPHQVDVLGADALAQPLHLLVGVALCVGAAGRWAGWVQVGRVQVGR